MDKANIEELKREVTTVFAILQKIDAPMTESNVAIMNACMGSMKFLANAFDEALKEGEPDGNADPE